MLITAINALESVDYNARYPLNDLLHHPHNIGGTTITGALQIREDTSFDYKVSLMNTAVITARIHTFKGLLR